ncbi:MAG TPA: cytochrome c [Gemmatimonadaceae bacterium]|nr:cytochrome c [Gemmatimonadaceae bacterium]
MRYALILSLLLAAAPLGAQAPAHSDSADHAAAGAYTEDQATRGKTVYESYCAACHTTSFHTDEQFRFNWFGRTVADLFKTLRSSMPEDNPGGLSDDDYTRVIAYILKLNGFAAGADSLTSDTLKLKTIRIRPAADSAHAPQ